MKKVEDANLALMNGGGNCKLSSAVLAGVGVLLLAGLFTFGTAAVLGSVVAYGGMTALNAYNCG